MRRHVFAFFAASQVAIAFAGACTPGSGFPTGGTGTGGQGGEGGNLITTTGPDCNKPTDEDEDFIASAIEGEADTDGDGTKDAEDTDSDNDGRSDKDEAANPFLPEGAPGAARDDICDQVADSDADGKPDFQDPDSDNDGVSDKQEYEIDPGNANGCATNPDCDGDGVLDLIELAAGSDPLDAGSMPEDPGLFFVLPFGEGEKTQDFVFSTGVSKADVYFLIDTTQSMQPAIDTLKSSLGTVILPSILNGDPGASPPIAPIDDAWMGIGVVRDVPWGGYGQPGDDVYRHRFTVNAQTIAGDMNPPKQGASGLEPPDNVAKILGSLTASGGGDGPEATTQALWIAASNGLYSATIGGIWQPAAPHPAVCNLGMDGVPCFRDTAIPIFVIVTDAAFHNGPLADNNYDPATVGNTRTYTEAVEALNALNAKIVGVPVAGGNPGAARADLTDLANKTGSKYHDPAFGGTDRALVSETDVTSGEVSKEVVRLMGLLSGAGLHDVTTSRSNYDCNAGEDCTGDGEPDLEYHNPSVKPGDPPFDASKLILKVATVPSDATPAPYGSLDETTFHDVRGAADLTFRVHAKNDIWAPNSLVVLRALIHVETPTGQLLGGAKGVKLVYFVIPEYIQVAR